MLCLCVDIFYQPLPSRMQPIPDRKPASVLNILPSLTVAQLARLLLQPKFISTDKNWLQQQTQLLSLQFT